jgi:hypothetical protein
VSVRAAIVFVVSVSAFVSAGRAAAEGRIAGQVKDASGAPLPGVRVEVRGAVAASAVTDASGRYATGPVADGTYHVSFRLAGFATAENRDARVAGADARADATLHLALSTQVVVLGRRTWQDLSTVERADDVIGLATAASHGYLAASQLEGRSLQRPGDILERVPGVVISQHSGEGKANQYYVRGFNIDHGTDLALFVAGVPVNMPTHGHGQGWADLNFLIPELVGGVVYKKGPYFADEGDFSSAAAIHTSYLNVLDEAVVKLEAGENGYRRGLLADSFRLGGGTLLYALEGFHNDGPWERGDDYRRLNGVLRYTKGDARSGASLTLMGYDGRWDSTDQVPERAILDGRIGRFGLVDPADGGRAHRYSLSFEGQRGTSTTMTRFHAYAIDSRLNLFSNFTYFLDDPVRGDQFEQEDDRRVFGLSASRQWSVAWGARDVEARLGASSRHDDIGAVGLFHTAARRRLEAVRDDEVAQTSGALFAEASVRWTPWLRTQAGLRGDLYRFDVTSSEPRNSGVDAEALVSPKLAVALGPWRNTELFANAGFGFHSNDGRGATITVDPKTGEPAERVSPLVRSKGAELGLRTLALPRTHATVALWGLDIDSELVFVGDAGTTEAGRPSRRLGVELAADVSPRPWLTLDASYAFSRARFRDDDPAGDRIPGAVEGVLTAGVAADHGRWLGNLRVRRFGGRPLIEDDSVRSAPSTLVTAQLGVNLTSRVQLKLDVFNLLDAEASDVDYFYASRLPGEPDEGVDDVHTHPVEPRTIRVGISARF